MKCYNSFGEMFRAQGGDRSVFNGIAQTKVTTRDPAGNTEEIYLRFSTEKPGRDSAWYYLEEASNKYKELSTAPKHIQAAVDKVGKGAVEGDFLGRVTVETKKNPKFDAADLSDEQLAKYLNAITLLNNGEFDWSVPGERKKNPNPNPNPKPKNKKETVMVSGIKMSRDGEITTYKIGYDNQGVAKAVSYDNEGHAQEEKNFSRFIGDNFKTKTEKDPDYMDKLGSKEIGIKLQYYCFDPDIKWYGGNLSRDELEKEVALHKRVDETKRKEREEYNKKHRPSRLKRIGKGLKDALGAIF